MWMYRGAPLECAKANTKVLRECLVCLRKSQEPNGIEEMGNTVLADEVREDTGSRTEIVGHCMAWHCLLSMR